MTPIEIAEKATWKRWLESGTNWTFERYRDLIQEAIEEATKSQQAEVDGLRAEYREEIDKLWHTIHGQTKDLAYWSTRAEQTESMINRQVMVLKQAWQELALMGNGHPVIPEVAKKLAVAIDNVLVDYESKKQEL